MAGTGRLASRRPVTERIDSMNLRGGARGSASLSWLLVCGALVWAGGQAPEGRERKFDAPIIHLRSAKDGRDVPDLRLRPNVPSWAAGNLVLENPGAPDQTDVSVELVCPGGPDGTDTVLAEAKNLTLEGNAGPNKGFTPVKGWAPVKPAAPAPAPATVPAAVAAAPAAPPLPPPLPLKGSSYQFRVVVKRAGKEVASRDFGVALLQPQDYVVVEPPEFKDNRLWVKVETGEAFRGPECPVSLVLRPGPGEIPDLAAKLESKHLDGKIGRRFPKCELYAEPRTLTGGTAAKGSYSLTVDHWERAFVYLTDSFAAEKQPGPDRTSHLRIRVAPYLATAETLRVHVEADNIKDWETAPLTVGLYSAGSSVAISPEERTGAREAVVRLLEPAADGALRFGTEVRDWDIDLNVRELAGLFTLRVRLQNGGEKFEEAEAPVALDATPPERVQFETPAAGDKVPRGETLSVSAIGSDAQTEIGRAVFFFGKPPADLKPPADAVEATRNVDTTTKLTTAKAELFVPADMPKGPHPLNVIFTNKAGLSTLATVTVAVVDPVAAAADKKPASIEGRVVEGTSPKVGKLAVGGAGLLPAPDRKVELRRGAVVVKEVTTDKDGKYKFTDVAPGAYTVFSRNSGSKREASVPVEVKESEQKTGVELLLKLL
jgi:hypothetical protein